VTDCRDCHVLHNEVACLQREVERVRHERDAARANHQRAEKALAHQGVIERERDRTLAQAEHALDQRDHALEQLGHAQAHASHLLERARAAEAVLEELPAIIAWASEPDERVVGLSLPLGVLRRAVRLLEARGTGKVPEEAR
jgi:multidrug resistance efflux pump